MDTAKTGAYLASLRKAAGMTQQDAADRLGVSNKTVSKWESGGGFPDITVLPALAELYGVTADDILAGEPVRPGSGGGRVEQYLARRGELRWRIGFSAAALFLLPAVYGLLRAAAVRWSGQGCLLNRPYLQVTGILWLISLAVEIVRWIVTLPPMQAFAATTLSSGTRTYQALWDKFAATLPFLYVPRITAAVVLTVLAVTALAVRRKNGAGAAQSKDEAA